ncbi:protein NRT1/ PTR FAMILY 5.6 [Cajanus cajan]|uniref:protein NRT1/ PTR FAMILY 5.6 n=1 Tax=Cajanus cajan TaxID=3821 RepID=UPI0010FBA845|nr:protein NRT1/ PTR FAMILY 5.6 [Cajanus cajan]
MCVKMEQETEKRKEGKSEENEEKWVHDASVDYKGRLPLRASTGVWKASLFILTIEFSERVCHFGLSSNLITYLTKVMHKDLNTATKNVNYWVGATTLMPLIGGFVADAYTGRYRMIIYSSLVYLKGLSMLTMSQFMPILKPCNNEICDRPRKFHEVVFFFALYCIALGTGGYNNFKIPPASMASVTAISSIISVPIYDKIIVPILRKVTGNERGISIFRRIGIGLTFLVLAMVVAALVETKRLKTVEHQVLTVGGTRHETMSVLWLIPQNLILGLGADSLSLIGLQEYFYDQVPDSMRSLGMALYLSVLGAGFFLSSFLIIIVDHVTGKNGRSWIAKDINSSRLDKFYWMLVVVNALNLCLFIFLAKRYTYKTVHRKASEIDGCNSDAVEIVA